MGQPEQPELAVLHCQPCVDCYETPSVHCVCLRCPTAGCMPGSSRKRGDAICLALAWPAALSADAGSCHVLQTPLAAAADVILHRL